MKNKRRTKKAGRGNIWMGVGLLLLFLAAAWSGYNILDARRADRAAQNTVEQLQQEIAQKQKKRKKKQQNPQKLQPTPQSLTPPPASRTTSSTPTWKCQS